MVVLLHTNPPKCVTGPVQQDANRWDKRGVVIKVEGNDQYQVLIDGSRRNRKAWDVRTNLPGTGIPSAA